MNGDDEYIPVQVEFPRVGATNLANLFEEVGHRLYNGKEILKYKSVINQFPEAMDNPETPWESCTVAHVIFSFDQNRGIPEASVHERFLILHGTIFKGRREVYIESQIHDQEPDLLEYCTPLEAEPNPIKYSVDNLKKAALEEIGEARTEGI